MIEDPLYLDKKTPVYMIGDLTNMLMYEHSIICKVEWEKFGYNVNHVVNLGKRQYDFFNQVENIYDDIESGFERIHFLSHIALWKKLRKKSTGSIITDHQSFIVRDLPRSVNELPFKFTESTIIRDNKFSVSKSYFIQPKTCHILYDKIMNYNGPFFTIGEFISRVAIENNWVSNNEQTYTIKHVL